jgi:8-oxo-dGTP pyrophosphatase MutT (NUDIX family)
VAAGKVEEVFRGTLIRVEVWPTQRREIVRHPGACAVVALTPRGDVVLVRQLREAVGEELLEIPAGIRDVEAEEPAVCAARELMEEAGYRAAEPLEPLGMIYSSPGFTDEGIHLFLAREVIPEADSTAGHDVTTMPLAEAVAAVQDGRIRDAKTAVCLLLASFRARRDAGH